MCTTETGERKVESKAKVSQRQDKLFCVCQCLVWVFLRVFATIRLDCKSIILSYVSLDEKGRMREGQ